MAQRALEGKNARKDNAFNTTQIEDAAIAAPAIIGSSHPSAATGMPITLYASAQNSPWRTFDQQRRDRTPTRSMPKDARRAEPH